MTGPIDDPRYITYMTINSGNVEALKLFVDFGMPLTRGEDLGRAMRKSEAMTEFVADKVEKINDVHFRILCENYPRIALQQLRKRNFDPKCSYFGQDGKYHSIMYFASQSENEDLIIELLFHGVDANELAFTSKRIQECRDLISGRIPLTNHTYKILTERQQLRFQIFKDEMSNKFSLSVELIYLIFSYSF